MLLSSVKYTNFCETYFRDPDDKDSPLKLEPGQKSAINALQFGYDIDAMPEGYVVKKPPKIVVMIWARQCLAPDTLIQLSDGSLKRIEETNKGDSLLSYFKDRFEKSAENYIVNNGIKNCVKITTKYGRTIKCTLNHPFLISESNLKKPEYVEAVKLKEGFKLAMVRSLPKMGEEILTDDEIKFLGYMIGDGCLRSNTPYFTNKTHDIVCEWKRIVKNWHQYRNKGNLRCMYSCKNKKLQDLIKKVGLNNTRSGDKFVPKVIFKSSTRQVGIFLSKLIDTDGSVYSNVDRKSCSIHYTSKSKRLIDDLSFLFTRIGMYGKITSYLTGGVKYYRIKFSSSQSILNAKKWLKLCFHKQKILDNSIIRGLSTSDVYPFLWRVLEIKKKRGLSWDAIKDFGFEIRKTNKGISLLKISLLESAFPEFRIDKSLYWDEIVKIEEIGKKQTYGLTIPKYHTHITNGFITHNTGKTTGVAMFSAATLCLEEGIKIGVMAQSEPVAKEFITKVKNIIRNSPFKKHLKKKLKLELKMDHGGYIQAHATSDSIRGLSYHILILDEAARISDDIIEGAALDTARKIGKRVIMLSTPDGYGGALVRYYQRGLKSRLVVCKKCFTEFIQSHFGVAQWDALRMAKGLPPCPECGYYEEDGSVEYDDEVTEGKSYFYAPGDYTVISVNPFSSSFYPKEEVLKELYLRGNTPIARQELLGEIISEGSGVFRKEWIDACMDSTLENIAKKKEGVRYMMGIDFGKVHDNSVIAVGHEDFKKNVIVLDYLKVLEKRREYKDIKKDIIEIALYFQPVWIIPDAMGMGEPIVEFMRDDLCRLGWKGRIYCNKNNRLGFIFDVRSKPDLIEYLAEMFARKKIKMPPQYDGDMEILYNELLNFSYEMTNANYIKFGVQTEHDDTVIAVALLVWGEKSKPWSTPIIMFGSRL